MSDPHYIKQLTDGKKPEEALKIIDAHIATTPDDADLWAEKGKILWKTGNRKDAITAYETSAQIDPKGAGALLLEHSRSIMDFFCTDLLNP